jgi:glycosyltransferase involved in cell wall biosynthesis
LQFDRSIFQYSSLRRVFTLHVAVLSFTSIDSDHRVLRTIATLAGRGYKVTAIGFGQQPPADCDFIPLPAPGSHSAQRTAILLTQAPAGLIAASAVPLHFLRRHHRAARQALLALQPDIVHANDCQTLPAAAAAKRAFRTRIVYDSHEFATEEHADNMRWRLVAQRHVREIERRFIGTVDKVITVSDGIAEDLRTLYGLPETPTVVRNTPAYQAISPREISGPRHLLFHGIMKGGRSIEATISALRHLPDAVLTLRGDGAPAYLAKLRSLARDPAIGGRVTFEAAVPASDVVPRAAEAHIGIFCAPLETRHNRFALPNKIFEYLMAGLAVVVTAGTDLADLVARYGVGVTASAATPEAIAAAINRISPEELHLMRGRALVAARELSWEHERDKLTGLYDTLAASGPASPPLARSHGIPSIA